MTASLLASVTRNRLISLWLCLRSSPPARSCAAGLACQEPSSVAPVALAKLIPVQLEPTPKKACLVGVVSRFGFAQDGCGIDEGERCRRVTECGELPRHLGHNSSAPAQAEQVIRTLLSTALLTCDLVRIPLGDRLYRREWGLATIQSRRLQ